jgi:hypothetical protein
MLTMIGLRLIEINSRQNTKQSNKNLFKKIKLLTTSYPEFSANPALALLCLANITTPFCIISPENRDYGTVKYVMGIFSERAFHDSTTDKKSIEQISGNIVVPSEIL